MQQNIEFERCIDFLVRMIDKYGNEVLRDTSRDISRYAVCRYYIDGKKTQRYNKTSFLHKSENFKRMIGKADESL